MTADWQADEAAPTTEGRAETFRDAKRFATPASGTSATRDLALDKHYSVGELAHLWGLSEKTIRRIFVDEPGVIKFGTEERRFKRGYITLRIPECVVQRVHRGMRQVGP